MILLLWISLYGVVFLLAEFFSDLIGVEHCITAFASLLYAVCLAIYSRKAKRGKLSYPFGVKFRWIDGLYFLPLLCLPIVNLFTVKFRFDGYYTLTTVGVCLTEEIFFRGFLLKFLKNKWQTAGIFLACALFALFHLANRAEYADESFLFGQVISAFAAGLAFSGLTVKYQSLTPSVFLHLAINLTGNGGVEVGKAVWWTSLLICSAIYAVYGLFIVFKEKREVG